MEYLSQILSSSKLALEEGHLHINTDFTYDNQLIVSFVSQEKDSFWCSTHGINSSWELSRGHKELDCITGQAH